MKAKITLLTLLSGLLLQLPVTSQIKIPATSIINDNNVSAYFSTDGTLDFNKTTDLPMYMVPKNGDTSTIFAGALWIGGLDAGGILHVAAQTYHVNGSDFWPGPMMDSTSYSPHMDTVWNKMWIVYKSTIDSFRKGLFGKTVPPSILNWPGNGNTAIGQMANLAPYKDSEKKGYYDPSSGDYPLIRGDAAMYLIFNDDRGAKHGETGGKKLGIEVHLMVYQYTSTDSAINDAVFLHYDIYNRSKNTYHNTYIGYWCDMDIGNGGNDYIACDSADNYWYTYNGTPTDPNTGGSFAGELGYWYHPPAQAVLYLCDTMNHFQYYNNDFSSTGNPKNDSAYYSYMKSVWPDSSHVYYFDTTKTATNYMFSGNPVTNTGWTEAATSDPPGDRRGLSSNGPLTLAAGASKSLDIALVFAHSFSGANISSVALLQKYIPDVQAFYNSRNFGCDSSLLGINEVHAPSAQVSSLVYPDPFSNNTTIRIESNTPLKRAILRVFDMFGREVIVEQNITGFEISVHRGNLTSGIYFYQIAEESGLITEGKFMME